jgi:cobalt-zinc-cadmium efflux system outer membrane protein
MERFGYAKSRSSREGHSSTLSESMLTEAEFMSSSSSSSAKHIVRRLCLGVLLAGFFASGANAQQGYTWQQVKDKFEAANPTLKADESNVQEMKAEEITAYLRPNPQLTFSMDGTQIAPSQGIWRPLSGTQYQPNFSYLHERDHKRELRLQSAQEGTQIAGSQHEDLQRNMLFNLRTVFVQTLQAKAVLELAKADLDYYDKIIEISRQRFKDGDLAQIDLDRIELLRVQYESEIQTAIVNLRTLRSSCYSYWTTGLP